jgi:adenylate cyclase
MEYRSTAKHAGRLFIGSVGSADSFTDFTALGDAVNTGARLATSAAAGEILINDATRAAAGLAADGLERRLLDLKGKAAPFAAFSLGA